MNYIKKLIRKVFKIEFIKCKDCKYASYKKYNIDKNGYYYHIFCTYHDVFCTHHDEGHKHVIISPDVNFLGCEKGELE